MHARPAFGGYFPFTTALYDMNQRARRPGHNMGGSYGGGRLCLPRVRENSDSIEVVRFVYLKESKGKTAAYYQDRQMVTINTYENSIFTYFRQVDNSGSRDGQAG